MRPSFSEFTFSYCVPSNPDPEMVRLIEQLVPFKPDISRYSDFVAAVAERLPDLSPEFYELRTLEKIWDCYRTWRAEVLELRSEPLFRELMGLVRL